MKSQQIFFSVSVSFCMLPCSKRAFDLNLPRYLLNELIYSKIVETNGGEALIIDLSRGLGPVRIVYSKKSMANVITADVKATNGVIHIIDDVLWHLDDEKQNFLTGNLNHCTMLD